MNSQQPNNGTIINNYDTRNLNKATYLMMRGALYKDVRVDTDGMATFYLDNVNKRHRDDFWDDAVTVELWTFVRTRKILKDKLHAKITELNRQK